MIESPCVNVCHMSPRLGVCTGCCRTLEEIARWSELGEAGRARVMVALPHRRQRLGLAEAAPARSP
jgi:predicted Fe-S protein YdhL (DUF1289 family)